VSKHLGISRVVLSYMELVSYYCLLKVNVRNFSSVQLGTREHKGTFLLYSCVLKENMLEFSFRIVSY
jgi:hypothetical protein